MVAVNFAIKYVIETLSISLGVFITAIAVLISALGFYLSKKLTPKLHRNQGVLSRRIGQYPVPVGVEV